MCFTTDRFSALLREVTTLEADPAAICLKRRRPSCQCCLPSFHSASCQLPSASVHGRLWPYPSRRPYGNSIVLLDGFVFDVDVDVDVDVDLDCAERYDLWLFFSIFSMHPRMIFLSGCVTGLRPCFDSSVNKRHSKVTARKHTPINTSDQTLFEYESSSKEKAVFAAVNSIFHTHQQTKCTVQER